MLSIVIPAYNEQQNISFAANTVSKLLDNAKIPFEIIFVDDGSKDLTWHEIQKANQLYSRVCGIKFSRNFGKESAIFAGLAAASGNCAVVIDCDMQQPPEKMIEMYHLWENGYEIVEGVKNSRGDERKFYGIAARLFYAMLSKAADIDMYNSSDYKLLDRRAVNALLAMPERNSFFRALSSWIGFKSQRIQYDVKERAFGTSKWSTVSLIKYALSNISSFSALPMQIVTFLGCLTLFISMFFGTVSICQKFSGRPLNGFTTVIIIEGFIGSIIMISLGIIGYYIAKIYDEVKGRPKYIVSDTIAYRRENETYSPKGL